MLFLLGFLSFTYISYKNQYQKDIDKYVENEVQLYKKEVFSSINSANKKFEQKRKLFYQIHKAALKIFQKDMETPLLKVQQQLKDMFNLNGLNIQIYLIDKNYTIFKTTFPRDLGFNLSIAPDAKYYLDKTTQDGEIYVSKFASNDFIDKRYKLYTYSKLNDKTYLELGFIDNNLFYNGIEIISAESNSKNKIRLYFIAKNSNEYFYHEAAFSKNIENKQHFINEVKKIPIESNSNDPVINAILQKRTIKFQKENKVIVYTPIFKEDMSNIGGFIDLVLRVDVDISEQIEALNRFSNIFLLSISILLTFLFFVFLFIKRSFTDKIDVITKNIEKKRLIDDKSISSSNDELSIIAKKYNTLFDSLNKEIEINKELLNENKRFIADTVHQIRTPLTNIMMNSEMIQRTLKSDKVSNFVNQINASINMLTNSYEDLAYVISYDHIEYKPTKVSISNILKERIKFFSTISKVNYKEIEANIEEDIFITINQIELERLIDNNISNGIKYAFTNKPITINLTKKNNEVRLEFKTYGKPIANKDRLFEKNYRENESKRGLGLGLNMVKVICEKYKISYKVFYEDGQNIFIYIFNSL
ncbi:sensor histidine kinase [Hydrogenimonas thermophila]|uniref:sensor histidine kinase n=1 Tax=Hydrogenimonas thermophila TaxID=223786 RepID=UPI001160C78D|nr:HAMP domain-containing sensor histidine kinase [Hydrogenimonas thermophila]